MVEDQWIAFVKHMVTDLLVSEEMQLSRKWTEAETHWSSREMLSVCRWCSSRKEGR